MNKQDKRTNPITGEVEHWIQPKGLPGIWKPIGFCDRCQTFKECLGLVTLTDQEWEELENFIVASNNAYDVFKEIESKDLKKCTL